MASIELSPGIVLDPDRNVGYVMAPDGGISAVDLETGAVRWHSSDADKPLLVADELLVGQVTKDDPADDEVGSNLRLKLLETSDRGRMTRERVVPLPETVSPMLALGAGRSFVLSADASGDDLSLSWEFRDRKMRALPNHPADVQPPEESVDGPSPPAVVATLDRATPAVPESSVETVIRGRIDLTLVDGDIEVVPAEPKEAREPAVVPMTAPVSRFESVPEPEQSFPEPNFLSRDQRHVLHSKLDRVGDAWRKYKWQIFERETGESIATLRSHVSYAPFVISGDLIVVENKSYSRRIDGEMTDQPPLLRGIALGSGDEVWSAEVREIRKTPPLPP